jgi:G3E family GTPase
MRSKQFCLLLVLVPQGVHSIFEGVPDRQWRPDEARVCKMVFIGRELDKQAFTEAFQSCLVCSVL